MLSVIIVLVVWFACMYSMIKESWRRDEIERITRNYTGPSFEELVTKITSHKGEKDLTH